MTDLGELKSHPARKDAFCNIKPHFAKKKKKGIQLVVVN